MSGPFKMKNSGLKMSAKSGSPMQANYASPVKDEKGKTKPVKNKNKKGKTENGNTTWEGKWEAAKDAWGDRHFIQSYNQNKKDIRQGKYIGFSNDEDKGSKGDPSKGYTGI